MPVLETLLYNKQTKTANDVWVYYNLDVGLITKTKTRVEGVVIDADVHSCGGDDSCPAGSFVASVVSYPNVGAIGVIPAQSPVFTAAEEEQAPTVDGDSVDVVCLPDPSNDVFICYDQGVSATPGLTFKPIPVKYNMADHYVRQRPENTISLSDMHVSNWDGVQAIRNRRCTIIVKISPRGTGIFSEIHYYCNVVFNTPPINSGNDGNASLEISADGTFSFAAVFAAAKV